MRGLWFHAREALYIDYLLFAQAARAIRATLPRVLDEARHVRDSRQALR